MAAIETYLIAGGASWVISKMADSATGIIRYQIQDALLNGNVDEARYVAHQGGVEDEFNDALRKFESRVGISSSR